METKDLRYELFDIKQKFLREIPHPRLIARQLKHLRVKGKLREMKLSYDLVLPKEEDEETELLVYLNNHIHQTLQLKQKISAVQDYEELSNALFNLYESEVRMLKKMQRYLVDCTEIEDSHIKMSKAIDTYAVVKRIKELNLKENEIKKYLCNEIKAGMTQLDVLTEACLQANKILKYG